MIAKRTEQRADGRRDGERERDPPADLALGRACSGAHGGREPDDDERCGRGRPDALVEHIDEHRQGEDRAATAQRAHDEADQQSERDRYQEHPSLGHATPQRGRRHRGQPARCLDGGHAPASYPQRRAARLRCASRSRASRSSAPHLPAAHTAA